MKITEMYLSIQGEGIHAGLPCYFIRTAGCDIRCLWCDTVESLSGGAGQWYDQESIIKAIPDDIDLLQITGGEPLLQQKNLLKLVEHLARTRSNLKILLETGGHHSLENIPDFIHIIMDIKLPGSGETKHDFIQNLNYIKKSDEIKFVISSHEDFLSACQWINSYHLLDKCNILFSPVLESLTPEALANWILKIRLPVRLQLQLHKIIWGRDSKKI